ncbi:MAG: hypothetical protein M1485_00090 [Chloroflexi bacterium]|nr:hypothetical protein [Chloroflexota bacterium]
MEPPFVRQELFSLPSWMADVETDEEENMKALLRALSMIGETFARTFAVTLFANTNTYSNPRNREL